MRRNFFKTLLYWKDHPLRMPLIVRGARQVGKTYIIKAFGKEAFTSFLSINFEAEPHYAACFETMNPQEIVRSLELLSRQKLTPGTSLLFLDEIQQCPKALQALRYFKEEMPELHVIAAGSLLEFAMQEEAFSFPVGRVQFAKLYPLSFSEFLDACGETALREECAQFHLHSPPPVAVHQRLLQLLGDYFIVGGMPSAVTTYLAMRSFLEVQYVQQAIWNTYENDFSKYAPKAQHRHMKKIFLEVPRLIGGHVKYNKIDPDIPNPAREMKRAIELLQMAGLVYPMAATSAGDIPLLAGIKESIFKLLFLDIGLVEQKMNLEPHYPGLMTGPLAEQFVGQELFACSDPLLDMRLFFWSREEGSAEVDYLASQEGKVYPIEVKAGKWGKLKSLHLFLTEKNAPLGIKISQEPLQRQDRVLAVPLYMTSHLARLIQEATHE